MGVTGGHPTDPKIMAASKEWDKQDLNFQKHLENLFM
jgi:hypothetical protein